MRICAARSTHRCMWIICSASVLFATVWYLIIDGRTDFVWIPNVINQRISPDSASRLLPGDDQTRKQASGRKKINAMSEWKAKLPSASSPSSLSIRAASFDMLNHPDAPKLQAMLTDKTYLKTLKTSCQMKDAKMYPYLNDVKATALMSFPRSGNTWTRNLVEKSTGYATTSLYCDEWAFSLGDKCNQSSVFLVKTHSPDENFNYHGRQRSFDQIVHLIRNPFDSIFSLLMYKSIEGGNQPVGSPATDRTGTKMKNEPLLSISEVKEKTFKYLKTFLRWKRISVPQVIIRYEDLKSSPLISLRLIRRFLVPLEVEVTNNSISNKSPRLMYYFDNITAFSSNSDKMMQYLREEQEKLLCSVREDLANVDLVYQTNKFDTLYSLRYYQNITIKFMVKELLEPLCFMKYDVLFRGYLDIPCKAKSRNRYG